MATTSKGIFYPTSSSNIAPLETHFATLAGGADNVGVIYGTQAFTGGAAAASTTNVNVTFTSGLFDTAPMVTAIVQGNAAGANYAVTIKGAPTTSGFTATVYKLDGTTAESLTLVWTASTYA